MKELVLYIQEIKDGGFCAMAVGSSIITQANTMEELKILISDAVLCHFGKEE